MLRRAKRLPWPLEFTRNAAEDGNMVDAAAVTVKEAKD